MKKPLIIHIDFDGVIIDTDATIVSVIKELQLPIKVSKTGRRQDFDFNTLLTDLSSEQISQMLWDKESEHFAGDLVWNEKNFKCNEGFLGFLDTFVHLRESYGDSLVARIVTSSRTPNLVEKWIMRMGYGGEISIDRNVSRYDCNILLDDEPNNLIEYIVRSCDSYGREDYRACLFDTSYNRRPYERFFHQIERINSFTHFSIVIGNRIRKLEKII